MASLHMCMHKHIHTHPQTEDNIPYDTDWIHSLRTDVNGKYNVINTFCVRWSNSQFPLHRSGLSASMKIVIKVHKQYINI